MRFVKYDITFETEREIFIAYGFPPHMQITWKKTRVKLDSENSLLVRSEREICIYEMFYDSCMLVESEEVSQEGEAK